MMKYESPIWAEVKANRNIYVTEDLARAAEIKALDAAYEQARREKMMINLTREEAQRLLNQLVSHMGIIQVPSDFESIELLRAKLSEPEMTQFNFQEYGPDNWGDSQVTKPEFVAEQKATNEALRTMVDSQREWVGLTDEEIVKVFDYIDFKNGWLMHFYRAIEAKLKEKNHG